MGRVALIGENSVLYVDILINIWNAGHSAVLIDWRIPWSTAIIMMREANVKKCYIESEKYNENSVLFPDDIEIIYFKKNTGLASVLPESIYKKFKQNYSQSEAVIIYSSGTTGTSKGIILSHYAINTNADAIIDYIHPVEKDCLYIVKPLSHSSTLTGELLVALKCGIKLIIAPTIVPLRFILNNVLYYNVTLLCMNPTLLELFARETQHSGIKPQPLRCIYVSGSILNEKVYHYARAIFAHIPIYNVYGLSEAGPRVAAQTATCCTNNSVGKAINGVEIAIVDEVGKTVSSGKCGIIHVNSPSIFKGYVSGIRKHPSLYNGWLNTGDIGYIDLNGELYITDRIDDMIIINSHKIYPGNIEHEILKISEIQECVVLKSDIYRKELLICAYVGCEINHVKVRQQLKEKLMMYEIPQNYIKIPNIPKNVNGKIDRCALQEYLLHNKKYLIN